MEAKKIHEAVEKHLGISIRNFPLNHYELLDVPHDSNATEVKNALKRAVARWNASDRKTNPESALLVANFLKQAQTDLLDETSRTKYDQSILAAIASSDASSSLNLFRAFEASECFASDSREPKLLSFGSPDDRWRELRQAIPQLTEYPTGYGPMTQAVQQPAFQPPSLPSLQCPGNSSSQPNRSKELMRFEQLKRARRNKNRLYVAGIFAAAFLFLAFAGGKFLWNREQVRRNAELARANVDPVIAGLKANSNEVADAVLSSAPNRQATKSANKKNEPIRSGLPTLSQNSSESSNQGIGMGVGSEVTDVNMAIEENESMLLSKPETPTEPESSDPEPEIASTPEMASTPMAPSMDSIKKWKMAMKDARAAIDRADFKRFHEQIEITIPLSTTDDMIAKQARLDQLGQLYEIFINSLKGSKNKLRATEVLTIGKRKINIVEITSTELIIKIEGKNEKYAWDRLPLGIALALADMSLNDSGPTDMAARAVYCSLSPAKNELHEKRAKEFFDKSVGKGEIRADLPQSLTDSYE